ncbi:MAG: hypothetical protein RR477_05395 [Raoultibacter sp.]
MLAEHCQSSKLVRQPKREKAYGVGEQPRALNSTARAKAVRMKTPRYQHASSQDEIDALVSGVLSGVRFSTRPIYNSRIGTPGLTKIGIDKQTGRKYANPVHIGKQAKPGEAELVDTLLHEELEARIWLDRHRSDRYWHLNNASDDERHAYIQKIIDRYVKMRDIS